MIVAYKFGIQKGGALSPAEGIKVHFLHAAANEGIMRTEQFFKSMGLPSKLSEVGIDSEKFEEMAEEAVRTSGVASRSYYPLQKEDIVKIFEMCE